jgi:hypothetical protein
MGKLLLVVWAGQPKCPRMKERLGRPRHSAISKQASCLPKRNKAEVGRVLAKLRK